MQVKDIMTADVATCRPDDNLAEIARIMWDRDCGIVPVIDATSRISGVITDRDICIASATRGRAPQRISAAESMHALPVQTVLPEDSVDTALAAMKQAQVRRLPVVTSDGAVAGIISMNDIALASGNVGAPAAAEIVSALSAICSHRDVLVAA